MSFKFDKSLLTATKFSTVEDKLKFCNQFVKFVESDFDSKQFPKWFYVRLSMCFGHIAHYNKEGFYDTWFSEPSDKVRFIQHTLKYPCYGSPAFTYCDAEKQIIEWLKKYFNTKFSV